MISIIIIWPHQGHLSVNFSQTVIQAFHSSLRFLELLTYVSIVSFVVPGERLLGTREEKLISEAFTLCQISAELLTGFE